MTDEVSGWCRNLIKGRLEAGEEVFVIADELLVEPGVRDGPGPAPAAAQGLTQGTLGFT